ncbi:bifunctional lysine-specific demethylase and histidyl-hydroxylase NO66 [Paragonimus westermani]|uniref:Bifunctional lysine-specific demethylase and histidyl-hydroxylase n=1 Tax=Paragonimus westermani TaxID=34504 RepID=A0A5J4NCD5_9TREM|nr:bifunctional lysine-specific demethylase and histidyl-hydroxylase NO66 [Paragonimus westermani]
MLSAREFYVLEKMQKQGKLENNPQATALIRKVTETLVPKLSTNGCPERLLQSEWTTLRGQPDKSTSKKKKKKRNKKTDNTGKVASNVVDKIAVSDFQKNATVSSKKLTDDDSVQPPANIPKLSRSQRKKLHRKLKKQPVTTVSFAESSASELTMKNTGGKKRQLSPTLIAANPPKKKCPSQPPVFKQHIKTQVDPVETRLSRGIEHSKHSVLTPTGAGPVIVKSTQSAKPNDQSSAEVEFTPNALSDPVLMGEQILEKLLTPITVKDFFRKYFEKNPLLIQRNSEFCNDWLSTKDIDFVLLNRRVMFTEHLDLASYLDGERYTLNPAGRAFRSIVWNHYNTGCSVRLLCPQVFFHHIRYRLSLLQEFFGSFVGANVYLTPPKSQGFAPHYDDIEAFILQLEGSKHWRVYAPRDSAEKLPRVSSPNFTEDQLGEPLLEVDLKPGDLLHLPRGYVHQARTTEDHSLHITISTYQKHTWGDFLSKLLPVALQSAMENDVNFRKGLPVGFLRHVGGFLLSSTSSSTISQSQHLDCLKNLRAGVVSRLRMLANGLEQQNIECICSETGKTSTPESPPMLDPLLTAADLFAVDLIGQSLPPQLFPCEFHA